MRKRLALYIIGISVALLVILTQVFFSFFLTRVLQHYLQEKAGSEVRVRLEKARLNLFSRKLSLHQVSLLYPASAGKNQDIRLEKVELLGLELRTLIQEGQIRAQFLSVDNPSIRMHWDRLDSAAFGQEFRLPSPLEKISEDSYIAAGKINQITVDIAGDRGVENMDHSMTLDLFFEDARAYDGKRTVGFFELSVRDYALDLPDGIHRIRAKEARLNTRENRLSGTDFSLSAIHDRPVEQGTTYDLYLPEWHMRADILELLRGDSLIIDSLFLKGARMGFSSNLEAPFSVNITSKESPYELIEGIFKKMRIKHLALDNAEAAYFFSSDKKNPRIHADRISLIIEDFLLDENSGFDPERVLLSRHLEGEVYGLRIDLKDSIHVAESEEIRLSSKERLFRAQGIQIRPKGSLISRPGEEVPFQYFTLSLPRLDLSGADLAEMINGRYFESANLDIQFPRLALYLKKQDPQSADIGTLPIDVYPYLSDFFAHVNVSLLSISQGQFSLSSRQPNGKDSLGIANLALKLHGLEIDSLTAQKTQNKIFYAENIQLDVAGYFLRLADGIHTLRADTLQLSSFDSLIVLKQVKLKPENPTARQGKPRYTYFDMDIPELRLEDITIKEAFYNENIKVGRVLAREPRMETKSFNTIARLRDPLDRNPILSLEGAEEILEDYFSSLEIKEVKIDRGHLNSSVQLPNTRIWLTDTDLNAEIRALKFEPFQGLSAQNTNMQLSNFYLALPDKTHRLTAEAIAFDLRKARLQVNGLHIMAAEGSDIPTQANIFADSLILFNYRPEKETFFVQETGPLEIYRPKVNLQLRTEPGKREAAALQEVLAPVIQVNGWLIQNGSLDVRVFADNMEEEAIAFSTELQWVGDTTLVLGTEMDYASKAIRNTRFVQLDNVQFTHPKQNLNMATSTLNYRNTSQRLEARNLDLILQNEEKQRLRAEGLILQGFTPDQLYSEKVFRVTSAEVLKPLLQTPPLSLRSKDEWKQGKRLRTFEINIEELNLSEGIIRAARPGKDSLEISGLSGSIKGLLFDETHLQPLLEAQPQLFFDGFTLMDKEGLYRYESGKIEVNRALRRLVIRDFSIVPTLSEGDFYRRVGTARDYVQLHSDSLVLEGLDYDAFFSRQAWIAEQAYLYGLKISDLKDRKWPENPNRRPPLPMELLLQLDQAVHFNHLHIHEGWISYEEYPTEGALSGQLEFSELTAQISNLSNIADSLQKNDLLILRAQAKVMNQAWVSLNFQTRLMDKERKFTMDGRLESMEMRAFNPVLKPLTYIEVVDGSLRAFEFFIEADQNKAGGRVRLDYRDLKVAILDEDSPNLTEEKAFTSFLANTFVIRKRSSRKIGQVPWQELEFEREEDKSIFNFWWKALLSGIKPALGL